VTPAQSALLKKLINRDRVFFGEDWKERSWEDRGVEVGWITGVNPKTASALVEAGLIEVRADSKGRPCAYLGSYDPYLAISEKI
jgi:hypothetical protein